MGVKKSAQCYSGGKIKNNEMGGACGKSEKEQSCIQHFGLKT